MVSSEVLKTVESLTPAERRDLITFIESLDADVDEPTDEQKGLIRSRLADLQANPGIGLSRGETAARVRALLD